MIIKQRHLAALTLSFYLLHTCLFPLSVYAQEEILPSPTPDPSPTIDITPTPTPSPIVIEETIENEASASSDLTADSNSGENTQTSTDSASIIETGTSAAIGDQQNTLNQNNTSTPTENSNPIEISLSLENQATASNTLTVTSQSGQNQIIDSSLATILSGDSLALANLVNLININNINSQFFVSAQNITTQQTLDLNQLWQQLNSPTPENQAQVEWFINALNTVCLQNNVNVIAQSGQNQTHAEDGSLIVTGDTTAGANVVNLANTNLFNSILMLSLINLLVPSSADIILPRFDSTPNSSSQIPASINTQNDLVSTDQVITTADSGQNSSTTSQSSYLETGNAVSLSQVFTLGNTTYLFNNSFILIINNLSDWAGKLLYWQDENDQDSIDIGTTTLTQTSFSSETPSSSNDSLNFNNQASVENNISVTANSGQNTTATPKDSVIQTGQSTAFANLLNLLNLNLINSKLFIGVINILSPFAGNIVTAYPDLAISLQSSVDKFNPGDTITYTITYQNLGYDIAHNPTITLPDQTISLPDLAPKSTASLTRTYTVNSLNASITTPDTETDTSNNQASLTISLNTDTNTDIDDRQPQIKINASNNVNKFVYPGDTVTFSIDMENTSDVPAHDAYLIHEVYSSNGILLTTQTISVGTINAQDTGTLSFGLTIPKTIKQSDNLLTLSTLKFKSPNNTEYGSNESSTHLFINYLAKGFVAPAIAAEQPQPILGATTDTPPLVETRGKKQALLAIYLLLFFVSSTSFLYRSRLLLNS